MKEKISLVIVNFDAGPGLVDSAVAAIADEHEVIVVDDASSDGSLELLKSYLGNYSNLRIVRIHSNESFAKASNRGVGIATGEFVFFLNPDCELEKGSMTCLLAAIQTDAEVGMVCGLLLNPDGSEQAGARRAIPTLWRSLAGYLGWCGFTNAGSSFFRFSFS